jgi:hypothetical protein
MCSGNGPSHRTSSDTSWQARHEQAIARRMATIGVILRDALSRKKTSGISRARSYRTYGDGSFEGCFPGTSCQATIVWSGTKIHSPRRGFDQVSAYGVFTPREPIPSRKRPKSGARSTRCTENKSGVHAKQPFPFHGVSYTSLVAPFQGALLGGLVPGVETPG